MRGIVLAGGTGTRLNPVTISTSKQLLPVFDKPMIYYPISTLMMAGIRDIAIICTPQMVQRFESLLGSGSQWGVNFTFLVQEKPRGIAESFIVAKEFIGDNPVSLILGDNLFHGRGLGRALEQVHPIVGAKLFAYQVAEPEHYGVVELNSLGEIVSIEEKPESPKSDYAITGLYFYDSSVVGKAENLKPSHRGELEITDLNRMYLMENSLEVEILQRGTTWLDTGTPENLHDASTYVRVIQERQGSLIGCPEEIGLIKGWISKAKLATLIANYGNNYYSKYLNSLI